MENNMEGKITIEFTKGKEIPQIKIDLDKPSAIPILISISIVLNSVLNEFSGNDPASKKILLQVFQESLEKAEIVNQKIKRESKDDE